MRRRALVIATAAIVVLSGCGSPGTSSAPTGASQATAPAGATIAPDATAAPATAPPFPAPPNPMELTRAAGLEPETVEHLEFHVHAHLDVFVDGKPILVPAGIGINIEDPAVKTFTEIDGSTSYGGIETSCGSPCISPLHTHAGFGVLHTESATAKPNTFGQFLTEWGVEMTDTCLGDQCGAGPITIYVNGTTYTGDPAAIELADRTEIAIVIGSPPAEIPFTADFSLP